MTRMSLYLPRAHPLSRVYRTGASLFGMALTVFGVLGFTHRLAYFDPRGSMIMGLSSNGALSTVSVVVGVGLVVAAVVGGAVASTALTVLGALFLLAGVGGLAVLHSPLNLLAFRLQNVIFSIVVGMLLLFVGIYGRVSGGLRHDNPWVRARRHEAPDADHSLERAADLRRLAVITELADAEHAVAEGTATEEQDRLVRADALCRAAEARRQAYHPQHTA